MFKRVREISRWLEIALITFVLQLLLPVMAAHAVDGAASEVETTESSNASRPAGKTEQILGVGWHPGFCETRPNLAECRKQTAESADASQFSLRGLWHMRKSYCGVPDTLRERDKKRKWLEMPELVLDADLKSALARAMPGTVSGLERHEWIKHGTCSGDVAAGYYTRALRLLDALNASDVRVLFQANLGKTLKQDDVQQAFDAAFGPGAGERVKMRCAKDGTRQVITGLTIGLGTVDGAEDDLGALIAAAGTTTFGCASGIADAAGSQ
jgi:ribonuclease T2